MPNGSTGEIEFIALSGQESKTLESQNVKIGNIVSKTEDDLYIDIQSQILIEFSKTSARTPCYILSDKNAGEDQRALTGTPTPLSQMSDMDATIPHTYKSLGQQFYYSE